MPTTITLDLAAPLIYKFLNLPYIDILCCMYVEILVDGNCSNEGRKFSVTYVYFLWWLLIISAANGMILIN
jgi:hypothetical protein